MLTFEQIKELIELVAQRKLQGLEVERSGFRLKIDGQGGPAPAPAAAAAEGAVPAANPAAPPAAPAAPAAEPAASAGTAEPSAEEDEGVEVPADAHVIKSPIVGTFYRAPSPDADPYVEVGDKVKKGQVLCIVEAMKLMNEIESEGAGTVVEIFAENAQPVEFGEPLFAVKPS